MRRRDESDFSPIWNSDSSRSRRRFWLSLLKSGTVLDVELIASTVVFLLCCAGWISIRHYSGVAVFWDLSVAAYAVAIYGFFLVTLLLGNFVSHAESRWWETRKHLGACSGGTKNFAMMVSAYTRKTPEARRQSWNTVRLACAALAVFVEQVAEQQTCFAPAPRSLLGPSKDGAPALLTEQECARLAAVQHSTAHETLLLLCQRRLALLLCDDDHGLLQPSLHVAQLALQNQVTELRSSMNAMRRISTTPMPLQYVQALELSVALYLLAVLLAAASQASEEGLMEDYTAELPFLFFQFVCFVSLNFWLKVARLFANPFTAQSCGGLKFQTLAKKAICAAYEIVHTDFDDIDGRCTAFDTNGEEAIAAPTGRVDIILGELGADAAGSKVETNSFSPCHKE